MIATGGNRVKQGAWTHPGSKEATEEYCQTQPFALTVSSIIPPLQMDVTCLLELS